MALNGMTDEEWWKHCGNIPVERGNVTRYEDLYQLFKRRMLEEVTQDDFGRSGGFYEDEVS